MILSVIKFRIKLMKNQSNFSRNKNKIYDKNMNCLLGNLNVKKVIKR